MFGVFLGLATLALSTLIASAVWAMRERGATQRRSGAAVHAEIVAAQVERGARLRDRDPGDERYVRAVIESSRRHPNGYSPNDYESAWVQPALPRRPR